MPLVGEKELADLREHGDYHIAVNSTFKRFFLSEQDILKLALHRPGMRWTKTFIDLPTGRLAAMARYGDCDVGNGVGIDVYLHPEYYTWFDTVWVVPW